MEMKLRSRFILPATISGVVFLTASLTVSAQQMPPGLQSRRANPTEERPTVVLRNNARSVLPEDASGLYRFDDSDTRKISNLGEGVQIDEQFGDVTGYLTIKGPQEHAKPALQSYFFSKIEGGGGDFNFTTKAIHGAWYSFEGKIVRGPGLSRADDAFYVLDGTLIAHDDTRQTSQRRTITLKLVAMH
jgi:hypothetical protein